MNNEIFKKKLIEIPFKDKRKGRNDQLVETCNCSL